MYLVVTPIWSWKEVSLMFTYSTAILDFYIFFCEVSIQIFYLLLVFFITKLWEFFMCTNFNLSDILQIFLSNVWVAFSIT